MYYYGARYYDPRISIFVSLDPLVEITMEPYQYVHNNPVNIIDPTGMYGESWQGGGYGDPKKERPRSATQQGIVNVGKKYLATAAAAVSNPLGTAVNMFAGISKELADFTFQDKGNVSSFATRKISSAYNSLQTRVKGSQDPEYEFKVAMAEMQIEAIISVLLSKGISTVGGRLGASGGVANAFEGAMDDVARFGSKSEGLGHFGKHGTSIQNALGRSSYNYGDYLTDANFVIKNGTYIPEINGYVRLIGGRGSAKFGFIGLNRQTGNITTFHIKTAKELAKSAPNTFKY